MNRLLRTVDAENIDELIARAAASPVGNSNASTTRAESSHNPAMSTVSKDLLDARLETIEVRMDARMARIEDSLKAIASSQTEVLASNKSTRTTMIVTGISSVLAIVLGVGAFNATVLSNMVASFESGKNTAAMQVTLTEATKALEVATAKAQAAAVTKPKQ